MTTHARNLPEGGGQPAPPPPPPDVPALAAEMIAATRAARQANAVFVALELDAESTFAQIYAAWDVAAAADRDAWARNDPHAHPAAGERDLYGEHTLDAYSAQWQRDQADRAARERWALTCD